MRVFLSLFVVGVLGCETIVVIDPPEYEPELVVTGNFMPDSAWSVELYRSMNIGDSGDVFDRFVTDATVTVLNAGTLVDRLLHEKRGRYVSPSAARPVAGTEYTLRVESAGEPAVEAVSAAPLPVAILDARLTKVADEDAYGLPEHRVYEAVFRIEDPQGKDFYQFGLYRYQRHLRGGVADSLFVEQQIQGGDGSWHCTLQSAVDGSFNDLDSEPIYDNCQGAHATDRLFDGRSHEFKLRVAVRRPLGSDPDGVEYGRKELVLVLTAMSKDYFEHQRTLEEHDKGDDFAEPVYIYSNVKGGIGIFAGYTNTSVTIPLSDG